MLDDLYKGILARFIPTEKAVYFDSKYNTNLDISSSDPMDVSFSDTNSRLSLARYKIVMGLILVSYEPASLTSMNSIIIYIGEPFDSKMIVQYLGSLLTGVTSPMEPIRPSHTSFYDFLTDPTRSGVFFVDRAVAHQTLAVACLRGMKEDLHFNMFSIPSSHTIASRGILANASGMIDPQLRYACHFWSEHCVAGFSEDLSDEALDLLDDFLGRTLLFWFEVVSAIGIHVASPALARLVPRIPVSSNTSGVSFCSDRAKDGSCLNRLGL